MIVLVGSVVGPDSSAGPGQSKIEPSGHVEPTIVGVESVGDQLLVVSVQHGAITHGRQVPYAVQPSDELRPRGHHRFLERSGQPSATLAGPASDIIWQMPRIQRSAFDATKLDKPGHWTLAHSDGHAVSIAGVHRKSQLTAIEHIERNTVAGTVLHRVYLVLDTPMELDATYVVSAQDIGVQVVDTNEATYRHDPSAVTEAVQVSQVGFHPNDPVKVGFVSLWMGDGGGWEPEGGRPTFSVVSIDPNGGEVVFTGRAELSRSVDQPETVHGNQTGTDVYRLDFSGFDRPGTYRLVVDGVGSSLPFPINARVWHNAHRVALDGLLHHRSGIELGPPRTDYVRPRPMHPDDGFPVRLTDARFYEPGVPNTTFSRFKAVVAGERDGDDPNAWGGYMDAADWDRQIEHLLVSRYLLDLAERFPELAQSIGSIQSGDSPSLPLWLDEALWGIDFHHRMQQADGGIPGGIEASEHPRIGEASWQESMPTYRFDPDPISSALYAATAAQAARVLAAYNHPKTKAYADSALAAMDYVDTQPSDEAEAYGYMLEDAINHASLELYALTGDPAWHRRFLDTTMFDKQRGGLAIWQKFNQTEAAMGYLTLDLPEADGTVRENIRKTLLRQADKLVDAGRQTAFGWTDDPKRRIAWGIMSSGRPLVPLVYAYRVSGDSRYLDAIVRGIQSAFGANPTRLSFTTGIGEYYPTRPMHIDSSITGQQAPHGITVFGPVDPKTLGDYWLMRHLPEGTHPRWQDWPAAQFYFDTGLIAKANEYTVDSTIAPTVYVLAHLAAWPRDQTDE